MSTQLAPLPDTIHPVTALLKTSGVDHYFDDNNEKLITGMATRVDSLVSPDS